MTIVIKPAIKFGAKLRLAIYGPSGAGKTMTALRIARELAGDKKIIVIDTERGSASKYADEYSFDVIELDSFHPTTYIEAIAAAERTGEYSVLIIDSASHEWEGSKGSLEMAGRDFTNWAKVTPLHNAFVDAMLSVNLHVIATMRAKEEYAMEKEEGKPKATVRKVGMEPIQRKGVQYEFDIVGSIDIDNTLSIVKTRCSALAEAVFAKPTGREIVSMLKTWLEGVPRPPNISDEIKSQLSSLYPRVVALTLVTTQQGFMTWIGKQVGRVIVRASDLEMKDIEVVKDIIFQEELNKSEAKQSA